MILFRLKIFILSDEVFSSRIRTADNVGGTVINRQEILNNKNYDELIGSQ